jgi:3-oxoadipate CoA-transferase alpha subunit
MINKITQDIESVLKQIPDGATIITSGFCTSGQPEALIDIETKELTIINNNSSYGPRG